MSDISYLRSGDGYIAYRVEGDGPVDLLMCDEVTMISIDSTADEPHRRHFDHRLASFARLITFDRAGIGLSDGPPPGTPLSIDGWANDALAVLDAVGSERTAVFGACGGGIVLSLWAQAPDRISQLIFFNGYASLEHAAIEPWVQEFGKWVDATTGPDRDPEMVDDVAVLVPSLADDANFRRWWQQAGQRGASPKMAAAQNAVLHGLDLREALPTIDVPTLVMCRTDARLSARSRSWDLAERIAGSRFVELPGDDYFPFAGDADAVADEVEEFLTGTRAHRTVQRMLTTIFFSDIVGSTAQATKLGDQEWRTRLDLHDAAMRRQFERFGGREVNTTGDGFLVCFDLPAQAIRAGLAACEATRQLGVEIRVGIHAGEVEQRDDDVGGIAVHIGARVLAAADPSTVFVSSTVRELVTGSGLRFTDRGSHDLKGVPGSWNLFEVVA
jgi:class 3 adenylate cyclase